MSHHFCLSQATTLASFFSTPRKLLNLRTDDYGETYWVTSYQKLSNEISVHLENDILNLKCALPTAFPSSTLIVIIIYPFTRDNNAYKDSPYTLYAFAYTILYTRKNVGFFSSLHKRTLLHTHPRHCVHLTIRGRKAQFNEPATNSRLLPPQGPFAYAFARSSASGPVNSSIERVLFSFLTELRTFSYRSIIKY